MANGAKRCVRLAATESALLECRRRLQRAGQTRPTVRAWCTASRTRCPARACAACGPARPAAARGAAAPAWTLVA